MMPQPSDASNPASAALAACVLGVVLSPFAYIAIGALGGFGPALALVSLPPLLAAAGFLLYRFLSKPIVNSAPSGLLMAAEVVSWILIAGFLVVISNFTLQTKFERIGLSCTLFLVTTVISLPVVLMRRTALQARLRRLPNGVAWVLAVAVLAIAVAIVFVYLRRDPQFV
ncbi:MAG TPA: hypothetical protein VGL53_20630 [Bryobacteraceae bacterium]